jgi:hypothetical protein
MERYVREILWTDVFKDADGPLWERVFGGAGHCHHCRARHARPSASGGEPAPLLRCATCKVAQYCSAECQKAAYWHHKRARDYDGHPVGCAAAAAKTRQ